MSEKQGKYAVCVDCKWSSKPDTDIVYYVSDQPDFQSNVLPGQINENKEGYIILVDDRDNITPGMWYDRKNSTPENSIFLPIEQRRYKRADVQELYEELIRTSIRTRYDECEEAKILRERLAFPDDERVKQKFEEYNNFILSVKDNAYSQTFGTLLIEEDKNVE